MVTEHFLSTFIWETKIEVYREREKQTIHKLGLCLDKETILEPLATSGHLQREARGGA